MLLPTYTGVTERGAVGGVGVARQLLCIVSMETFVQLHYTFGSIINYILRVLHMFELKHHADNVIFILHIFWCCVELMAKQGMADTATPCVRATPLVYVH